MVPRDAARVLIVPAILALASPSARADTRDILNLTNVQSVDGLGDPDNDVRQLIIPGGYTAGTLHIFGTITNPNAVVGTRPSDSFVRMIRQGDGQTRIFRLSETFDLIAGPRFLISATLSFDGIDPAGIWSCEFYESVVNSPGQIEAEWTSLTLEFEDRSVVPNGAEVSVCQLFDLTMEPIAGAPQRLGNVVGLTMATTAANIGFRNLIWNSQPDERHPFIAMNLYRIENDRFEQIGMSWLKHGFNALSNEQCGGSCNPTSGLFLGVGCDDTYTANTNAFQPGLGPRFEVDPWTGSFTYAGSMLQTGIPGGDTAVTRRLQVHDDDLDSSLHPGAEYRFECFYVARDDADATNNAAWKPVTPLGPDPSGVWTFAHTGASVAPTSGFALEGWTGARLTTLAQQVPVDEIASPDGRCILGVRTIDQGDGTWRYEYALLNMDMARQVGRFELHVPFGVQVTAVGFSAPLHHDEPLNAPLAEGGVPIDNAPWNATRQPESVIWQTTTNPLRFATVYSFWFTADRAPVDQSVTLGLFRPGAVMEVSGLTDAPVAPPPCLGDSNGDRVVDFDDIVASLGSWQGPGPLGDANADGIVDFDDVLTTLANWMATCP